MLKAFGSQIYLPSPYLPITPHSPSQNTNCIHTTLPPDILNPTKREMNKGT